MEDLGNRALYQQLPSGHFPHGALKLHVRVILLLLPSSLRFRGLVCWYPAEGLCIGPGYWSLSMSKKDTESKLNPVRHKCSNEGSLEPDKNLYQVTKEWGGLEHD